MPRDGSLGKETVITLFILPGEWIENLMEKTQSAAYIINLINNKIASDTNEVKTAFIPIMTWLRAATVQAKQTKKHAGTLIKFTSILNTPK